MSIALSNEWVTLELAPDNGAKVSSLRCLRHGREWLAQARDDVAPSAQDVFGAYESWGWDELFPTVLAGSGAPWPWGPPLRDHGELWGRSWDLLERSSSHAVTRYADGSGRFEFGRTLTLQASGLRAEYRVLNLTARPLPFLWSMHPILSLLPGERLVLPGVNRVSATHVRHPRLGPGGQAFAWPVARARDGSAVRLDQVTGPDGRTALKLYVESRHVAVEGGPCRLGMAVPGQGPVGAIGLYLNYGGWPKTGSPLHQVGLEPTTAGVDDLATAVAGSRAAWVEPSGESCWTIDLRFDSVEP